MEMKREREGGHQQLDAARPGALAAITSVAIKTDRVANSSPVLTYYAQSILLSP